jgi:hypothetical protein
MDDAEGGEGLYRNYFLGDDGLIAGSRPAEAAVRDAPSWPLADVAGFLAGRGSASGKRSGDVAASLIALALAFPVLFQSGRSRPGTGNLLLYNNSKGDKQAA